MKAKFKQKLFSSAVRERMFSEMIKQNKRIGVRKFANDIGISAATLSRIENGKTPDIETFFKICHWMNRSSSEFYPAF